MSSSKSLCLACLLVLCVPSLCTFSRSNVSRFASSSNPALWTESSGLWSAVLEDWAIGSSDHRQERILKLPNTSGYYISNRVDTPPTAPPPTKWSQEYNPPTKIVNNRPPQYSGNYQKPKPEPNPNQPHRKEVSETDLYLLGAIEKLVYRVDFMEKRLKKTEELVYYIMAGNKKNPEPCPKEFARAGTNCYHFAHSKEVDWKSASSACKDKGATLAEMENIEENQDVVTYIQANAPLRGKDFWTGGLNPGLLWIWSNSARPVVSGNKSESQLLSNVTHIQDNPAEIKGNGRCLKLAYNPTLRTYAYLGFDCAGKQNYICEIHDKSLSNQIQRISKDLKLF